MFEVPSFFWQASQQDYQLSEQHKLDYGIIIDEINLKSGTNN